MRKDEENQSSDRETTPLISKDEEVADVDPEENTIPTPAPTGKRNACSKILETIVDWLPFIVANVLIGNGASPVVSLGAGAVAAACLLLYHFAKKKFSSQDMNPAAPPRLLEIGQFVLFASCYISAFILCSTGKDIHKTAIFLNLWFNPITTGGMALIMWLSVVMGRPFVYDFAQEAMPEFIWLQLSSKKYFRKVLDGIAIFWYKSIFAMTVVLTIVPVLLTCFYGGDFQNDPSGRMMFWNNIFLFCQLPIFVYAMYVTNSIERNDENTKKRSQHVRLNGLPKEKESMYSSMLMLDKPMESYQSTSQNKNLRIESLTTEEKLDRAGYVLTKAFEKNLTMENFLDSFEGKLSFYNANVKSLAYFHHILAVYDHNQDSSTDDPRCVMAVVPVLSKNQEEINVFNNITAWQDHGFIIPGGEFTLPSDELVELGTLKSRPKHGLTKRKYILIVHFGADPDQKGKGYGRALISYIAQVSQYHQLPLVLEATTSYNISAYQKFGFKIIDHVEGKPGWVLMLRECEM